MADSYLQRTVTSAESPTKLTFSVWVKRSELGRTQRIVSSALSNYMTYWRFSSGDILELWTQDGSGNTAFSFNTKRVFRDVNSWYNIVMSVDTTQATEADRFKVWVNGVQETDWASTSYPPQNETIGLFGSTSSVVQIGRYADNSDEFFSGSLSHLAIATGYAYTSTDFGSFDSTSGIWKFKSPNLANWGTNGVHLKFENSGALGTDSSGNSNTYTVNGNLKQSIDTPSNVFATLNPLVRHQGTINHGNTRYDNGGANWYGVPSTIPLFKGKYYWEYKCTTIHSSGWSQCGVMSSKPSGGYDGIYSTYVGNNSGGLALNSGNGDFYHDGSSNPYGTSAWFSGGLSAGDIIGVALDVDASKIWFSKNGTWGNSSNPATGSNGIDFSGDTDFTSHKPYIPCFSVNNFVIDCNFGTGYFGTSAVSSAGTSSSGDDSVWEYDCPTGYYGLNTKNINTYG